MSANSNFRFHKNNKPLQQYKRSLHLEALEERALLSVSPAGDPQDLAAMYSSFPISEDANYIDVADLTADNLRAAIDQAAQTTADDVIVVHTTAAQNTISLNGSALVVDIDSDLYGSLTLVGYGDSILTLRSTQENVAVVSSGEVYFGGISFLAMEARGQSFNTDNLVVVSDGAEVTFSRTMRSVRSISDTPVTSKFAVNEEIAYAGANDELMPDSAVWTHSYTTTVHISGTKYAFVAGLTESDYNQLQEWEFEGTIAGNFIDAEKDYYDNDDEELCWAGSASDMLWYTGWANSNIKDSNGNSLFLNEDDVFEYFEDHFTDAGSNAWLGCSWFLSGVYEIQGDPDFLSWAQLEKDGGGFYPNVDLDDVCDWEYVANFEDEGIYYEYWQNIAMLTSMLERGYAIGLGLGWYPTHDSNYRRYGHAITAWGYVYDTAYDPDNDQAYYQGLLVTDSDNNHYTLPSGVDAPNTLTSIKLAWDDTMGMYHLSDYSNKTGYLENFYWLVPYTAEMETSDTDVLRMFLELTDSKGVKNGTKLNADYNPRNISTWTGVTWDDTDTKALKIEWNDKGLVGDLNLSGFTALAELSCDGNSLSSLDVSDCTALTTLSCNNLNLTSQKLNFSGCTALTSLSCNNNRLTTLDVSDFSSLQVLNCNSNQLTTLDVSNNTALTNLDCGSNQLKELNVASNTALTDLNCSSNQLSVLNVSSNTALTSLDCSSNQLIALDVYQCSNLSVLKCQSNQLAALDLSRNAALTELWCWGTALDCVRLSSNRSENLKVNLSGVWTFTDVDGTQIGTSTLEGTDYFYTLETAVVLPVFALKGTQKVTFIDASMLSTPSLSVVVVSYDSVLVTIYGVADAEWYRLQYSTDPTFPDELTTTLIVQAGDTLITGLEENTTYYFRVQAIGSEDFTDSVYCTTVPSRTETVDVSRLREFLEQTDTDGVKNGTKLNANYDPNNTATWGGVTWTQVDGGKRVRMISWDSRELVGNLDLTGCIELKTLICSNNQINTLNLTGCAALTKLNCDENQLTSLVVSDSTLLTELSCGLNQLTSLDVTNNTALTNLSCGYNQLTSLDVTKNTALTKLYCWINKLSSLNVTNNTALTVLSCGDNLLTSLDVTKNTLLTYLDCSTNQLTTLNVSKNTELEQLDCCSNQLNSLDVSKNTKLTQLRCSVNQISTLKLENNTKLWHLDCRANSLTQLDLHDCILLKEFYCDGNQLTSLDLTKNSELIWVGCTHNQLTDLDVSSNYSLRSLYCGNNELESVDLSNNTALTELDCSSNLLTALDLTKNTALDTLWCWNPSLNLVLLSTERTTNMKVCLEYGSVAEWTYQGPDGNGLVTGKVPHFHYDVEYNCGIIASTTALPVYATNDSNTQTVMFADPTFWILTSPTLIAESNGPDSINVTIGGVPNASDYKLQYSVDPSFKTGTKTLFVTPGTITLNNLGVNTRYYFRVLAVGTGDYFDSPFCQLVTEKTDAYSDVSGLRAFLEQADSEGVKNGTKLSSNYNPNDISTWGGITWELVGGARRATEIDWNGEQLVGDLDLSDCTALRILNCDNNNLTSLDVSGCDALISLSCNFNQLTSLVLSQNAMLSELSCTNNQLTSLDASDLAALTILNCNDNQLAELNVSGCTALENLSCVNNQLTSLNLATNTSLTELVLSYNQLTSLDLSNNIALEKLWCDNNQLADINTSKNEALTFLNTSVNQLMFLDMSSNTALTVLDCSSNRLTSLDLSKNAALAELYCWNSSLNNVLLPSEWSEDITVCLSRGSETEWTFADANGGALEPGSITYEGVEYTCCALAETVALPVYATNEAGTQTIAFATPETIDVLPAPTLSATATGYNSIAVNVGSVENASGYRLQYSTEIDFSNATTIDVSDGKTFINNLAVKTKYYFRVKAIGSVGYWDSDYSETRWASTANAPLNKLDTPTLSVTANSSSEISVTVGGVENASGYWLEYSTSVNFTNVQSQNVSEGTTSIDGLNSNTTYYFRVMALGSGYYGNSDYSATQSATTRSVHKLDTPTLSVTTTGTNSVSVTVSDVENASAYTLEYSTDENFTSSVTQSVLSGTSTVNNLSADTTYYFRVKATGSWYYEPSDFSEVQSAKTYFATLAAPTLSVSAAGSNSVYVTVGNVPSAFGYRLQYSTDSDFADAVTVNVQAGSNTISNLTPNTRYYFHVMAIGAVDYSDSEYSPTKSVVVKSNYIASDADSLRDFLELTDSNGVKNGKKLNSKYDPDNIATWTGSTWEETNGVMRVTSINWYNKGLVGDLDLSGSTSLGTVFCYGNQLTSLNASGCTNMTWLRCEGNNLTSLNVSGCTRLSELECNSNPLTDLDVTTCPALEILACSGSKLETVAFNAAAPSLMFVLDGDWVFRDANNRILAASDSYEYRAGNAVALPITAESLQGQKIKFVANKNDFLATPTLSVSATGSNSAAVTVGSVANASGYTLQYSTSENFTNAASVNVAAGTTTISGLSESTTYYFRVKANGSANYNDSDFSAVESVTTEAGSGLDVSVEGKKVTVMWTDANPTADSVRYRAVGTTQWKTQKLREGVTMYSFNGTLGTNYEIEVLLDQQEANVLNATAVVLEQPKLSVDKNATRDDTFTVNVTNYTAKNLATNATQALVTVNGVQTAVDIQNQSGAAALAGGGNVTFNDGQFTFTEMASNTSYKVQVSFAADGSVSTPSSALTVKTLKTCYEAPAITSATAISDTAVTVTWSTAYGKNSAVPAQAYTVQYSLDGVKWTNATTKATGNAFTIQKLKGGNEYQVRVIATKDSTFEASAASDVWFVETLALPKVALDKASVTDDSFVVNVTNYQDTNLTKAEMVTVTTTNFGSATIDLQNGTGSGTFVGGMTVAFNNGMLTFANVPSNTQLKVQLSFTLASCTTALSQAVTVKTTVAAYTKPALAGVTVLSSTSIKVDWETAYGKNSTMAAQAYTVQYSTDGVNWTNATTKATGNSFTIQRLKPNTKYLVAVVATKDQWFNASEPSDAELVTTLA